MIADLISGLIVLGALLYLCGNSISVWVISAILLTLAFLVKTFLHIEIGIKSRLLTMMKKVKGEIHQINANNRH